MHLPSRVQWVGISFVLTISFGGYEMEALVSISLRLGNLLKPMIGLSGNVLRTVIAMLDDVPVVMGETHYVRVLGVNFPTLLVGVH